MKEFGSNEAEDRQQDFHDDHHTQNEETDGKNRENDVTCRQF